MNIEYWALNIEYFLQSQKNVIRQVKVIRFKFVIYNWKFFNGYQIDLHQQAGGT